MGDTDGTRGRARAPRRAAPHGPAGGRCRGRRSGGGAAGRVLRRQRAGVVVRLDVDHDRRRRRPRRWRTSTRRGRTGSRAGSRPSPRRWRPPTSRSPARSRPSSTGLYVRNGSNPRSGTSPHWFLGDGMLHGVRVERGKAVWYRNRWVRTPLHGGRHGLSRRHPRRGEQPEQRGGRPPRRPAAHLGRGGVALRAVAPTDLSTVGAYDFDGKLGAAMTAHPKVDPGHRRACTSSATGSRRRTSPTTWPTPTASLVLSRADRGRQAVDDPRLRDHRPATRCSGRARCSSAPTGRTEAATARPAGMPSYGSRIGVHAARRPGLGDPLGRDPACYVFHGLNAHPEGDDVVLVVSRLDSAFVPGHDVITDSPTTLHRWRIGTAGELADLPRRDDHRPARWTCRPTTGATPAGRCATAGSPRRRHDGAVGLRVLGPVPPRPRRPDARSAGSPARWSGPARRSSCPPGKGEGEGWLAHLHLRPHRRPQRPRRVRRAGRRRRPGRPGPPARCGCPTASTASGSPTTPDRCRPMVGPRMQRSSKEASAGKREAISVRVTRRWPSS